jgi:hypothetical protein
MSSPITVPLKATQLVNTNNVNNDTKHEPKLQAPIVVGQKNVNNKKKSNNSVGRGMAGIKLDAHLPNGTSTSHSSSKRKLGVEPSKDVDLIEEDTVSEEEHIPDEKKVKPSTTNEEVEEIKFPEGTTWFPENWRNQTVSKLKDGPVCNVFVYWEKIFGIYGVSYKLLNKNGQYFWSTSDVVHWLETGICDMTKENLCTKRLGSGKILCGKCNKSSEDIEALNKVNH